MTEWRQDQIDDLKTLWTNGYSASRIAAALGVTRNAVIGRVNRSNLQRNPKPKAATLPDLPPAPRPAPPPPPPPVPENGVPLLDTSLMHCRWPLWGSNGWPEFLSCGQTTWRAGASYCEKHHRLSAGTTRSKAAETQNAEG